MTTLSTEFLDLQTALAGEYSLERELGRGGMGVVYLARDVQLDRHVAIKVLPAHLASQPEARERFLREARTAAGLSHPNIVPIHRVGEAGGFVFFVMSYVAGHTLGERLREHGPLGAAEAIRLLREVAWALAYAHGRGIVHRDVKPDNILLEEESGRALVTDFGIAHVGSSTLSTDPGKIMGTAHFMSPEQATSESVDGRSDLYSLGVLGYLAVSGRLPFEAANVPALLMKQVSEAAQSIDEIAPGTPRALSIVIHRCLEKEPSNRFENGESLAAALSPSSEGRPELPAPLRNWLAAKNPATVVYAVWSGLTIIPILSDINNFVSFHHIWSLLNLCMWGVLAAAPLIPIIGFHKSQARRLFRAGFTLADLRGALDVAAHERAEADGPEPVHHLTWPDKAFRLATYGTIATWLAITFVFPMASLSLEKRHILVPFELLRVTEITTAIAAVILLAAANMKDVPILPSAVRRFFREGIGEKLWRSRFGAYLAKQLGAPVTSRPVGVGVFQPTELALGVAASDLFNSLPSAYREQLGDLPSIVAALEFRARAARAEIESLDKLAQHAGEGEVLLAARREGAKSQLSQSVAALEGVRLDLLRLHAGATDLMPLTTLLDAAKMLGEDLTRLAAAQQEVAMRSPIGPLGAGRVATPA